MLKKIMAAFCCLLVLVPSVSVFAGNDGNDNKVQEGGHYEVDTEVGKQEDLWGARNDNQSSKPPSNSPNTGSGNNSEKKPEGNSESVPIVVERKVTLIDVNKAPGDDKINTGWKTLYWEWKVVSGPGTMTIHSSDRKVEQAGKVWHAGQRVIASFSAAGIYTVHATEVREKTTTITPVTIVQRRYFVKEYIRTNPSITGWNEVKTYYRTVPSEEYGEPMVKKEVVPRKPVVYTVRVKGPEPIEIPLEDKTLRTTSKWIFSRRYACTSDITDDMTGKPYELEVTYIFEANTTITEVFRPEHLITRYKNLGTMLVIPVDWTVKKLANNKVMVWAKFSHPKAAVPGKSPIIFKVRVKTQDGTYVVTEQIDVPVNTINLRFTDVPESETGEFYPIQGLTKFNNQEFVKEQPTVYHANIYIP